MYLTLKEKIIMDADSKEIIRQMEYSAYKLWNVANYEKRNFNELKLPSFPDWYDQKKRLKTNFFYKNLPSQSAQDVLQRLQEAWTSFFVLKETRGIKNPKPPRFKQDGIPVTFKQNAIKASKSEIRLTIPKQLKDYLKTIGIDANFIYLKTKRCSDIKIKEVTVIHDGNDDFMNVVYEIDDKEPLKDNGNYLGIDLGIVNNFSCADSKGNAFIISSITAISHYYDKKIAYYQGINSKQQIKNGVKYPKPSKRIKRLYKKKANSIKDFIHKASRRIINYCKDNDINTIVIGDIKNIREDKDLGRTNQQFHSWPYDKIYLALSYKAKLAGINFIKVNEAYSSQCPPDSERVSGDFAVKKNRVKRGLYKDGKNIYNADCLGAYNIMRSHLKKKTDISFKKISNPSKVIV
jgi:putative transposase